MSNTVVIADASPLIALARIKHLHRNCKTTGKPTRLIIDDAKGRAAARRLSLELIGSAGIIATANRLNLIPHARPLLEQLRASGYYISQTVIDAALKITGE